MSDTLMDHEFEECSELEKIEIELLLEGVYRQYGFDFREYTFSSIRRRIWHRVKAENLHTVSGLIEKALHDPTVMEKLFQDFSINVTEMFRDPSFFKAFREQVIPHIKDYPLIRIWHAGCSTGEEVFSMAILLHEEGLLPKSRLYATDINERVIEKAKQGILKIDRMKGYTHNYLQSGGAKAFSEYYTVKDNGVQLHPFLMEHIVFAQHNLVTDGSINEFHVIVCRNVLIYFNRALQDRVHQLFFESLSSSGFLALGNREGIHLTQYTSHYEEFEPSEKIYRKK